MRVPDGSIPWIFCNARSCAVHVSLAEKTWIERMNNSEQLRTMIHSFQSLVSALDSCHVPDRAHASRVFPRLHRCKSTAVKQRYITRAPAAVTPYQSGEIELMWAHSLGDSASIEDRPRSYDDGTGLSRSCLVKTPSALIMTVVRHTQDIDLGKISQLCNVPLRSVFAAM